MDFWFLKNVTGRKLVGMRWHNVVLDDGTNEWNYERATDEQQINSTDKTIFWTGLVLSPMVWSTIAFLNFVQLEWDWMCLAVISIVLTAANLVGFWKCSSESKRKVHEFASSTFVKSLASRLSGLMA